MIRLFQSIELLDPLVVGSGFLPARHVSKVSDFYIAHAAIAGAWCLVPGMRSVLNLHQAVCLMNAMQATLRVEGKEKG